MIRWRSVRYRGGWHIWPAAAIATVGMTVVVIQVVPDVIVAVRGDAGVIRVREDVGVIGVRPEAGAVEI